MGRPAKRRNGLKLTPDGPCTLREEEFCHHYVASKNGTEAARSAGSVGRQAVYWARNALKRPRVQALLGHLAAQISEKIDLKAEDVLSELLILLKSDVRHFTVSDAGELVLVAGAPDEAWRAVSSVKHKVRVNRDGDTFREIEYRLWSKPDAAKMLGEHLKLYTQKHEIEIPAGSGVLAVPVAIGSAEWAQIAEAQQRALIAHPPAPDTGSGQ